MTRPTDYNENGATVPFWDARAERMGILAGGRADWKAEQLNANTEQWWTQAMKAIEGKVVISPKNRVIDLGCGPGRWWPKWHEKGVSYIGVDVSENMVSVARKANPKGIFICHSAESLPFSDFSIDIVWMVTVLQHMKGALLEKVASEIQRVLAPRGHLLMIENTAGNRDVGYMVFRPAHIIMRLFPMLNFLPPVVVPGQHTFFIGEKDSRDE